MNIVRIGNEEYIECPSCGVKINRENYAKDDCPVCGRKREKEAMAQHMQRKELERNVRRMRKIEMPINAKK